MITITKTLITMVYGIVFGLTNVIPGASGATMLLSFGCYETVFQSLSSVLEKKAIKEKLSFLIPFIIGILLGILAFSIPMAFVLKEYPIPAYMFLIGLLLGSVPLVIRTGLIKSKQKLNRSCIFPFIFTFVLIITVGVFQNNDSTDAVTVMQSVSADNPSVTIIRLTNNTSQTISNWILEFPEGSVEKAGGVKLFHNEGAFEIFNSIFDSTDKEKKTNAFTGEAGNEEIKPNQSVTFSYVSRAGVNLKLSQQIQYEIDYIIFAKIMLGSLIAALTMAIPGIPGSYTMILFGIYTTVMGALKDFNFLILIPAIIGVPIGIIAGAKLTRYIIEKYPLPAYSVILGLILGSVYILFPEEAAFNPGTFIGIGTMILGGAITLTVGAEKRSNDDYKKANE